MVETENTASIRCLLSAGFIQDGDLPDEEGFLRFSYYLAAPANQLLLINEDMQNILPTPRRYEDPPDLDRMLSLLQAGRASGIPSYYVHTGDLLWWLFYPPLGASWWEHIYLWEDPTQANRLLGFALIDPNGETFDVYCQPSLHSSSRASAMFACAEVALHSQAQRVSSKHLGMYWVVPQDEFRIHWLESSGYRVESESPALARPLLEPIPDVPPPQGYQIRTCAGLAEVEARALAQYGAFASKAPFAQYVERFAGFMRSPAYARSEDVIAAAPDGRIAAFCITWADPVNRVGLFEPVGTHPDFQRLGLGRAVMLEALRRLQAQGMRQAIVTTGAGNAAAISLYFSLGFIQYSTFRYYTKSVGATD